MTNIIDKQATRIAELEAELKEYEASFDLRWDADMRAIRRWQEDNPERELIWPDHTDLCVWLMDRLEEAQKKAATHDWVLERLVRMGAVL